MDCGVAGMTTADILVKKPVVMGTVESRFRE
jgi:hypothetical protein